MDPNATLRLIGDEIADNDWEHAETLAFELFDWLRNGGLQPDWIRWPEATGFYDDWVLAYQAEV